jgi:hypothetical protein
MADKQKEKDDKDVVDEREGSDDASHKPVWGQCPDSRPYDRSASKHPAVRDDLIGGSPVKFPITRDSSGTAPGRGVMQESLR